MRLFPSACMSRLLDNNDIHKQIDVNGFQHQLSVASIQWLMPDDIITWDWYCLSFDGFFMHAIRFHVHV